MPPLTSFRGHRQRNRRSNDGLTRRFDVPMRQFTTLRLITENWPADRFLYGAARMTIRENEASAIL